jgi:hypothetical protein
MGLACIVCVGNRWPELAGIACKEKFQFGFKIKAIIVPFASPSGRDLKKFLQVQQISHFFLSSHDKNVITVNHN